MLSGLRNGSIASAVVVAVAACLSGGRARAETGDADGDGRLSLADSVRIHDHVYNGAPVPEETWAGYREWVCFTETEYFKETRAANVYLESLRRACGSSFPHWDDAWGPGGAGAPWEPAPVDARFEVRVESITAAGGDSDRADVTLVLSVSEPVRAFSVILDIESSVLRPAIRGFLSGIDRWDSSHWRSNVGVFRAGACGDFPCSNSPHTYLISGGKFIVGASPMEGLEGPIPPGVHVLNLEARLGKGTAAGVYSMRLHPGSEVVFADGALGSPSPDGPDAELFVLEDVRAGWDEGVPPLRFDPGDRRVLGKVEFRLAGAGGRAPEPGEPLFSGLPGEEVRLRVQMRTEVPLNHVRYKVGWSNDGLDCGETVLSNLFINPEDGQPYEPVLGSGTRCAGRMQGSVIAHIVELGGHFGSLHTNYPLRPLEYFKPLGEWIDLVEVKLRISGDAAGGSLIPLQFAPYHGSRSDTEGLGLRGPAVQFQPYQVEWTCDSRLWPGSPYWSYEVIAEDAWIEVLGENPPPPDPGLGVAFDLADAVASPGDVVDIPVRARSEKAAATLRLALGFDPEQIEVVRFDAWITSLLDGLVHRVEVPKGGLGMIWECIQVPPDREECYPGNPVLARYHSTAPGSFFLETLSSILFDPDYPGSPGVDVGSLIVRVRDGAAAPEIRLAPAEVAYESQGIAGMASSGGLEFISGQAPGRFSPAISVTGGAIRLGGARFTRGDANLDGRLDISDAVFTLAYLFLGQESPGCLDAADADDSGAIDITDPAFLLASTFLGGGPLPPPHPGCGTDPPGDPLPCLDRGPCGN